MSCFIDICFICLKTSNNLTFIEPLNTNETSIEDKLKYLLPEHDLKSNIPKYICAKCENNLNTSYEFKQKCLQNITTYEKYAQQITTTDSNKYLSAVLRDSEPQNKIEFVDFDEKFIIKEELIIKDEFESDMCYQNEVMVEENVQMSDDSASINNKCEICSKSVKNLEKHQLIHTNTKPFTCKICNKSFRLLRSLKTHRLIHSGKKPYSCKFCKKSFRDLSSTKRHQLIHTGEKPYICEVCNRSFRQSSTLKGHRRVHIGEKPFTCEVCSKSFEESSIFEQHKLVHINERPIICEICFRPFINDRSLKRHLKIHEFKCAECTETFSQKTILEKHILEVHRKNDEFTEKAEIIMKSM